MNSRWCITDGFRFIQFSFDTGDINLGTRNGLYSFHTVREMQFKSNLSEIANTISLPSTL